MKQALNIVWTLPDLALKSQELADEMHRPIIKGASSFRKSIWGAYLAGLELTIKQNKGIRFLLCIVDNFSKYACVAPLK